MDIPSIVVAIGGSAGFAALFNYLSERAKARATAKVEEIKATPVLALAQVAAQQADSTARHKVIEEKTKQDGETERQEITSTVDIARLAFEQANSNRLFADGVVKALQQCEERSAKQLREQAELDRKREEEHATSLANLTKRYEEIITDIRRASDERDKKTRAEIQPFLDNYSAIEETFKSQTEEFAAYRAKHPSTPEIQAQRPQKAVSR